MSCVYLLAADKPLPLVDRQGFRTKTVRKVEIGMDAGFKLEPHSYHRDSVDGLGHPMKHYRYELSLEADGRDLDDIRRYLAQHFSTGGTVELWHLWVGEHPRLSRYHGNLSEFDMDTVKQFLDTEQVCFTITI